MRLVWIVASALLIGAAAQACPDWRVDPTYGTYDLNRERLEQGQMLELVAGGASNLADCNVGRGTDMAGFVERAPDVRFMMSDVEGLRLRIWVEAVQSCDTVLVLTGGTIDWYYDDDDAGDMQAAIVLTRPVSGQLDVWVGTYDGGYCDARLMLAAF
ncbi:MAG: hypothetical protein AAGL89_16525 [Pseudomonadota bacterium]